MRAPAARAPSAWRRKTAWNSSECSPLWRYSSSRRSKRLRAARSAMASPSGWRAPSGRVERLVADGEGAAHRRVRGAEQDEGVDALPGVFERGKGVVQRAVGVAVAGGGAPEVHVRRAEADHRAGPRAAGARGPGSRPRCSGRARPRRGGTRRPRGRRGARGRRRRRGRPRGGGRGSAGCRAWRRRRARRPASRTSAAATGAPEARETSAAIWTTVRAPSRRATTAARSAGRTTALGAMPSVSRRTSTRPRARSCDEDGLHGSEPGGALGDGHAGGKRSASAGGAQPGGPG